VEERLMILPSERRRSPGVVILALLSACAIAATACNPDANRGSQGAGASQSAPAATSTEPAGSDAAEPSGSDGEPSGSAGQAEISGAIEVGAKYADADEIATVRYDTFSEQYPDVDVTFTEADFEAQAFLTAVAAGNPPDVVQIGRDIIGGYAAQGALEPLDSCIESHGIDMGQYREQAVTEVTLNDQVWGIPQFFDSRVLFINQSVIDEVRHERLGRPSRDQQPADGEGRRQHHADRLRSQAARVPSALGGCQRRQHHQRGWQ
jgi:maltose-binding protein MalE